ncbi:MAG TPA: 5-formyltetrahydrofolate cyclo-ligase [Ilumatobacteraceae bacterium]|nr:5-formyltetrahydrofolate cyclo-ligase [Ilumatobacteraceae bacterium]
MADCTPDKPQLRRHMRELRRSIDDRPDRSEKLWSHVVGLPAVVDATRILAFRTIVGEPEVAPFESWCVEHGAAVAVPEDDVDPAWPDVVIVPGLAFTTTGQRLGQGGGWYDRFLVEIRDDCATVGVCFHEQLLAHVPVETHDVSVDHVVTDRGVAL